MHTSYPSNIELQSLPLLTLIILSFPRILQSDNIMFFYHSEFLNLTNTFIKFPTMEYHSFHVSSTFRSYSYSPNPALPSTGQYLADIITNQQQQHITHRNNYVRVKVRNLAIEIKIKTEMVHELVKPHSHSVCLILINLKDLL